jgi:hypothetical protein
MRTEYIDLHKIGIFILLMSVIACSAKKDYPGMEYAPNMYHSVAYEPQQSP